MDKNIEKTPIVSVVMSVYNAEDYLRPAIDSILNQTFKDFEFIIIDDGSTDKSLSIIKTYTDPRIILISRRNKGLTASLNEGIKKSKGRYIARQDADDVSIKDRLYKEVEYLDSHTDVGLVGSNYIHIDEKGEKTGARTNIFTHPSDLKACLVLCNQYGHGSIMMRRNVLDKTGLYDSKVGHAEDYDLWIRISRVSKVANIEEPLFYYRNLSSSVSHSRLEEQIALTFKIRDRAFDHFLTHRKEYNLYGIHPSGEYYLKRKSTLFRNYAFLAHKEHRLDALKFMCAAIILQPLLKKNYIFLLGILYKRYSNKLEFEFL